MSDEELLQDEHAWDFEAGEAQRASRGRRSVVSVGFKPEEFRAVNEAARRHHQPLSQFIREAALEKATDRSAAGVTYIKVDAATIEMLNAGAAFKNSPYLQRRRLSSAS